MTAPGASTIIVVEDDMSMSQAIARLLRLAGHETLVFPSAEALLERGVPPNAGCVILDIHLPGLTGFELHQRLMLAASTTPVIFITAYDDAETQVQAQRAGAFAYLSKPFGGHRLLETVRKALNLRPAPLGAPHTAASGKAP